MASENYFESLSCIIQTKDPFETKLLQRGQIRRKTLADDLGRCSSIYPCDKNHDNIIHNFENDCNVALKWGLLTTL